MSCPDSGFFTTLGEIAFVGCVVVTAIIGLFFVVGRAKERDDENA